MIFEDPNDDGNYLTYKKESQVEFDEELSNKLQEQVKLKLITEQEADKIWKEHGY